MAERLLVLAVDIDDVRYRKARIAGPVIGKEANLSAATKLAMADPQDPDANTMFEAVRKYEELKKKGYSVSVATVTGAEKEGYIADSAVARQLDMVIDRFKPDSCVLVTDGMSDMRVLPMLKTRLNVNSVDLVRMKQAEDVEGAYFTVFEKLKEPHYARIVFGIPAVLILLFAISYYFNFGWQLPAALIGIYLLAKGFGVEDSLVSSFKGLGFSIERLSFVFFASSIVFFVLSLIVGYGAYTGTLAATHNPLTVVASAVQGFLILFPVSLVLYIIGKVLDSENRRMRYRAITQGTYMGYGIVTIAIVYLMAAWIVGQVYFWQFLLFSTIAIIFGYLVSRLSLALRSHAIRRTRMKDKQVINDIGAYVGRVSAIDAKRGLMMVKTDYGNVIRYEIDRITSVSDRIIVK
jgi:putative membrane protein